MNHFHTKKHTILRRFLCSAMVLALLSPALTFVQPIEAQASYVDTNMNTFIHDAADTPVAGIGQDFQLTVKVGFNGVNGLYNPTGDVINNVRVRLSQDQNLLNTKGIVPNSKKSNPYDGDSDNEQESLQHDAYN